MERMADLHRRLDDLKVRATGPVGPRAASEPTARTLAEVVGGRERRCTSVGYWHLETDFGVACARHGLRPPKLATELGLTAPFTPAAGLDPWRSLVLDIETGGFSGTEVFLIGFVPLDARPLRVVQFLARDYAEEEAIVRMIARLAATRDTWVTFNGKSFDEPFLRDRAARHHIPFRPLADHVDVLHLARRQWRSELPNCRLQTLEQHRLGWQRVGDVPGADIPDLFHHFIRTKNAAPLRPVLEHNQLDLISSTDLLLQLG
jgi:uncharacterized protein YprB with RNaseH-like and TPR domain